MHHALQSIPVQRGHEITSFYINIIDANRMTISKLAAWTYTFCISTGLLRSANRNPGVLAMNQPLNTSTAGRTFILNETTHARDHTKGLKLKMEMGYVQASAGVLEAREVDAIHTRPTHLLSRRGPLSGLVLTRIRRDIHSLEITLYIPSC